MSQDHKTRIFHKIAMSWKTHTIHLIVLIYGVFGVIFAHFFYISRDFHKKQ